MQCETENQRRFPVLTGNRLFMIYQRLIRPKLSEAGVASGEEA